MTHILFLLKHILTLLLIKIPVQLSSYILVPVLVAIKTIQDKEVGSNLEDQRLPKLFRWFDVGDKNDLQYGLNGDIPHQLQHLMGMPNRDPNVTLRQFYNILTIYEEEYKPLNTFWRVFKMRVDWLMLRNPINYFQNHVLGREVTDINEVMPFDNLAPEVGDYPGHVAGFRYREVVMVDGERLREYYLIKVYPFTFTKKCFRLRIGFKLGHDPRVHVRDTIQWVCAIQPWKTFGGYGG